MNNIRKVAATIAGFAIFALNLVLETITGTKSEKSPIGTTIVSTSKQIQKSKCITINKRKENNWTSQQAQRLNELQEIRHKRFLKSSERREYRSLKRQKALSQN